MRTHRSFRLLIAVAAACFLLPLSLPARPAGSPDAMAEVTIWALTLPDGQVIKVAAVEGQDSPASFKHGVFPYWLNFKAGTIDPATGSATFELSRSRGPEGSFKIIKVLETRTIEPFSMSWVSVDVGFDLGVEIQEIRKVRASELRRGQACKAEKARGGGDNCCVSCGSNSACGCSACLPNCGSCCNTGCFCVTC